LGISELVIAVAVMAGCGQSKPVDTSGTLSDSGLLCGQRAFTPSPMAGPTCVDLADGGHVPRSVNHPALLQFTNSCYVGVDVAMSPARNVNVVYRVKAKDGKTVAMLIWMKLGLTAAMTVSDHGRVVDTEQLRG
jgi:hypothetical protein